MQNDPIVEEIRRAREKYAAKFGYDLKAIYKDIKRKEKLRPGPLIEASPIKRRRRVRAKA